MNSNYTATSSNNSEFDPYPCPFCGISALTNEEHLDTCYFTLSEKYRANGESTVGQAQKLADAWKKRKYPQGYKLVPLEGDPAHAYKTWRSHWGNDPTDHVKILRDYNFMVNLASSPHSEVDISELEITKDYQRSAKSLALIHAIKPSLDLKIVDEEARKEAKTKSTSVHKVLADWVDQLMNAKKPLPFEK